MGIPSVIVNKTRKQYIHFDSSSPELETIHSKYKMVFSSDLWCWNDDIIIDYCCFNDPNQLITSETNINLINYERVI